MGRVSNSPHGRPCVKFSFTEDRLVLNGADEGKVFVLKMAELCRVFGKCIQVRY